MNNITAMMIRMIGSFIVCLEKETCRDSTGIPVSQFNSGLRQQVSKLKKKNFYFVVAVL